MDHQPTLDRRDFIRIAGVAGLLACSGCTGGGGGARASLTQAQLFDPTTIRRLDVAIDGIALMEADLGQQRSLPRHERDFVYVDAIVSFEGEEYAARVRFKGNSSLLRPLSAGQGKLPLKLKFGKDQRFLGFRKINLANNFKDPTMVRELLTTQLLNQYGAYAPRVVPVRLRVNREYWGVYSLVEQVDKTFLQDRFGGKDGNLYKPAREGGALTEFIPEHLVKKTNKKAADFSDIEALVTALTDPATVLDTIFDVPSFVSWLAVSAVVGHYDSYITARQNYYLYNNPATGLWSFISWDHNEALGASYPIGFDARNIHTVDPTQPFVRERPLTERVLADHRDLYEATVDRVVHGSLGEDHIEPLHDMMRPWVDREAPTRTLLTDPTDFDRSLDEPVASHLNFTSPGLRDYIEKRRDFLMAR